MVCLVGLAALVGANGCTKAPESALPRLNVLILVLDAVRADRLGFAGYDKPTSPNLDALAREGVFFENAFASATWTKPSIATLFTSRHPSEHGLLDLDSQSETKTSATLDPKFPVVAESFQRAGWATGAVLNQPHVTAANGFARGFGRFRQPRLFGAPGLNRELEQFLVDVGTKPFFAYVHYLDAHWPYEPVPRWLRPALGNGHFAVPPPHGKTAVEVWKERQLDPSDLEALSSRYDAGIRLLDLRLGELIELLRRRGVWNETLLVVTADHGEGFLEHGEIKHGFAPYVEVTRVPLLVCAPARFGFAAGARESAVGGVDLTPTLLDLAGLPPLPDARGNSLRSILAGNEEPSRLALTQTELGWALRDSQFSYLAHNDGRTESFDRAADPKEAAPLTSGACHGSCAALASHLRRLRPLLETAALSGERRPLSPEDVEELRALGYL